MSISFSAYWWPQHWELGMYNNNNNNNNNNKNKNKQVQKIGLLVDNNNQMTAAVQSITTVAIMHHPVGLFPINVPHTVNV